MLINCITYVSLFDVIVSFFLFVFVCVSLILFFMFIDFVLIVLDFH